MNNEDKRFVLILFCVVGALLLIWVFAPMVKQKPLKFQRFRTQTKEYFQDTSIINEINEKLERLEGELMYQSNLHFEQISKSNQIIENLKSQNELIKIQREKISSSVDSFNAFQLRNEFAKHFARKGISEN